MATAPYQVQSAPFPTQTKTASAPINNTLTTVTSTLFTDKILLTITFTASASSARAGCLSHWVHVPLATSNSTLQDPSVAARSGNGDLLPRTDLTATTVLGGTKREDEAVGQTLATMLASQILVKRPGEERLLVLGLGPVGGLGSSGLGDLVGLCLGVL